MRIIILPSLLHPHHFPPARAGGRVLIYSPSPSNNTDDNCVSSEIIAIFFSWWFSDVNCVKRRDRSAQMWWCLRNVYVLVHVRACGDGPVSW